MTTEMQIAAAEARDKFGCLPAATQVAIVIAVAAAVVAFFWFLRGM
jgi:hypothetical protein